MTTTNRTHDAPAGATLSNSGIRERFPALQRTVNGHPVAYFDGPGGTQVPASVAAAVSDYLLHHNANTHWNYPTSRETDDLLARARGAMGDFLNAPADEVVFGANMTTLTFHLARALGWRWGPGAAIVVTALDHRANVDPWRTLAKERGVELRLVEMDTASGDLDWQDFDRKVTDDVVLVAVCGASNALGTVVDLDRAREGAHRVGAELFVDAVHSAPHLLPDVDALGADYLVCSPYKFYGPHVGVLWGRRDILETLPVPRLAPASDTMPERLETGTLNHEGIVGAAAAVEFLADLTPGPAGRRARLEATYAALHSRGVELLARLMEGLAGLPGLTTFGRPAGGARTPTLAFTVDGHDPAKVAMHLADEWGVFVSDGDFYASTVVDRLGLASRGGLLRAGVACFTNREEVDRLVAGVTELI
jgi:cysteine desulfurase family protein (TIGR01976 family)